MTTAARSTSSSILSTITYVDFGENCSISGCESEPAMTMSVDVFGDTTGMTAEQEEEEAVQAVYLGCCSSEEAFRQLTADGTFGLYHKSPPLGEPLHVNLTLSMHIAYRSSSTRYKHFAVQKVHHGGRILFRVEADTHAPAFISIGQMVRFYSTYVIKNIEALPITE